jgi:CRISPR system Cascade subunit CasA
MMNLITDAWIPVRRKSGKIEKIAPWQVTDPVDPIMELAVPRPDFNGALVQFLIGLLQTTCAPEGNSDWRKWLNNPPSTDELKEKFDAVVFAFNLDGDGPRFMQDLTIEKELKEPEETVDSLLMDSPGGQTLKFHTDLFVKRGRIEKICPECAAMALFTLQTNAPAGGQGYRVGLRGGGPVCTIITGNTLWETVWCNVLEKNRYEVLANSSKQSNSDKFPWCDETRISKYDKGTTGQDIHSAQIYWSMPRRIRLAFKKGDIKCDLCGGDSIIFVKNYFAKPHGVMYKGIVHPLTPTYKSKEGDICSVHQHENIGYKHWLGFIQSIPENNKNTALIIGQALSRRLSSFRLWVFGYDMDNMKACGWYEGMMPVVTFENENKRKIYEAEVAVLIRAAGEVSNTLRKAVRTVLSVDKNIGFIVQRFWQETEPEFYRSISNLRDVIDSNEGRVLVKINWHKCIAKTAEDIFDTTSQSDMIEEVNVKRIAKAGLQLRRDIYAKKIKQEILGLPQK